MVTMAFEDCIESGRTPSQRYPQVWRNGRVMGEHRAVYEDAHGPIESSDLFVCHACDNPRCINIDHLFLGSNSVNILDAVAKVRHSQSRKTHCVNGHEFTEANTYVRTSRGWTERMCRTCRRERMRRS